MNSNKPKSEIAWEKEVRFLANFMHNCYEEKAGKVGWETQENCRTIFKNLPKKNQEVMLYVAGQVLSLLDGKCQNLLSQSRQQFAEEIDLIIDNEIKEWQRNGVMTNIAGGAISALKTLKARLTKK